MLPLLLGRIVWRGWRDPEQRARWHERFGWYRDGAPAPHPVWVHAVSVGEAMAAVPLVRALREHRPGLRIVVTTTTTTGADTVRRMLGDSVTHAYFAYDLPPFVRAFLQRFRPHLLVVLETELWPNTFAACRAAGVAVLLANARLSARSLRGYQLLAPLARDIVADIDCIAAQGDTDAARFRALGARRAQLCVTGSLKFDLVPPPSLREQAEVMRRTFGVNRPVLMFGSTRDGEEVLLLEAVRQLAREFASLLVILAPRHPERFDEVAALCVEQGLEVARYSHDDDCTPATAIYLVDVMGELPRFYAAADVAFVGGSLLPYGGQNVLEPAALGTPVLSGPHTHNFAEICALLRDAGALVVVEDVDALVAGAGHWLRDSNERDRVGRIAEGVVRTHRGATARTLELIESRLPAPG
ncbi:MAG: lipid IV(A) 3-deoxy-D-manno-octulosonic acid transferase [Gammaproteobacteria bacterium]